MDALQSETFDRLKWFIKLRWLAITGFAVFTILCGSLFNLHLFSWILANVLLAMLLCNLLFSWMTKKISIEGSNITNPFLSLRGFANLQIGLDLIFLTILWHQFGGIENPLMFFFVFHMIIASILLSKRNSYAWAIFSSLVLIVVAYLEYSGNLSHNSVISQLTGIELWNNLYWNIFILGAFCFTLICVVYMTSSIAKQLRKRNKDIIALEKMVADKKLQDAKKKLYFSEKMAALGKLAAGMAHEINNPLTTVLSYSECLADEIKDENQRDDVNLIIAETMRIRDLVKKVLNFARAGDQAEPSEIESRVDVNKEISDTVIMVQGQVEFMNIIFYFNFDKNLPQAKISKEHLKQIIINVMINASQAMHAKGKITIETVYDSVAHNILMKVIDTGPGIKPEYISRVFDPFFTTKKHGEGTGLGLAVSYGLMKMYDGDITVESELDKGSTFTVIMPAVLG
jgi:signal transduction histidine kinase